MCACVLIAGLLMPPLLRAQPAEPPPAEQASPAAPPRDISAAEELAGRTVEAVEIRGNQQVSTAVIRNVIRTREGDRFDPATVEEDYRRIYTELRAFTNVEARVQPTETGVIVIFEVTEQRQVRDIVFRGNTQLRDSELRAAIDIRSGEAIDQFRLSLARGAVENLYRQRNFPFAHVTLDTEELAQTGNVIFNVVEGPNVRVRNVNFRGNRSFSEARLQRQIQTRHWVWILRPGTFDAEQIEDDVGALRRFYEQKGFFDVRVGRKVIVSPDMSEIQVDFLIEEGPRYTVENVIFKGNETISDVELRQNLRVAEGTPYDYDLVQRDIRQMVRAYSPYGFIYVSPLTEARDLIDPDYLQIEPRVVYRAEPGRVDLVYEISEGKPFNIGRIIVRGNTRTQDKVILREMRVAPGQLYNSAEIQDAQERLRGTPFFSSVSLTPIGDHPETRDVLVEVTETRTASFNIGAGINSNGGVGGNITYTQRNFDITNPPSFIGAGQTFRLSLEPGTRASNASILFTEPWIFDQPYSFTGEAYLRDRIREDYTERRIGGRTTFGKRFDDYIWSARITLRGEDVNIHDVEDPPIRAQEILDLRGHSLLTSVGLAVTRDTTNPGIIPYRGTTTTGGVEQFGALGGDFTFTKLTAAWDCYITLGEDLLERRTVLSFHADAGYIVGDAPFFERFYGGGIGSIRGFSFRGISPRSGPDEDRIGGDFSITGTAELSFPLAGEVLRGVVFTDVGTVEEDFRVGTIRSSVGTGIRLILPVLGHTPIALDFAWPVTKDDQDDTQLISFSLGIVH